jgi:hypothetical protein
MPWVVREKGGGDISCKRFILASPPLASNQLEIRMLPMIYGNIRMRYKYRRRGISFKSAQHTWIMIRDWSLGHWADLHIEIIFRFHLRSLGWALSRILFYREHTKEKSSSSQLVQMGYTYAMVEHRERRIHESSYLGASWQWFRRDGRHFRA